VIYVKFFHDVACQKLTKLINVSRSYSKNKSGTFFIETAYNPLFTTTMTTFNLCLTNFPEVTQLNLLEQNISQTSCPTNIIFKALNKPAKICQPSAVLLELHNHNPNLWIFKLKTDTLVMPALKIIRTNWSSRDY